MAAKKSVQLSGVVVAFSAISSIDPEAGVLMYRGYDIAELAEHSTYEEVAYLLLHGELPRGDELSACSELLAQRDLPAHVEAIVGPLHGGANEAAMKLFQRFGSAERTPGEVRAMLERKEKLYGFGHPLYRAYDPRALILKRLSHELSEAAGEPDWYAITEAAE